MAKFRKIFFVHIPKCAGSTVYSHIARHIPERWWDKPLKRRKHTIVHTRFHNAAIETRIVKARQSKFISGHFDNATLFKMEPHINDFIFTFLRSPESRLRSAYRFFCSNQGWKWVDLPGHWSDYSYEDYLRLDSHNQRAAIDNAIVRQLGGELIQSVEDEHTWLQWVDIGFAALKNMQYVGFQHRFSDDLDEVCRRLGLPHFSGANKNISQNQGEFDISTVAENLESQKTRWDRVLYERALAEFCKDTK